MQRLGAMPAVNDPEFLGALRQVRKQRIAIGGRDVEEDPVLGNKFRQFHACTIAEAPGRRISKTLTNHQPHQCRERLQAEYAQPRASV
jgi:hypothetical protein